MIKKIFLLTALIVYLSLNVKAQAPLLYTHDSLQSVIINGKLGVDIQNIPTLIGGIPISHYRLFVKGGILTEEIRVRTGWADYVYEPNYQLIQLDTLNDYLKKNKHLPNVPTAKEIENNGLSVGEICKIQQEKIEELSLYIIQLHQRLQKIEQKVSSK